VLIAPTREPGRLILSWVSVTVFFVRLLSRSKQEEDNMALRPLHDRILVKRLEEGEQQSEGGIIIPDTAREKPQQASVLAVGTGRITDDGKVQPMDVKAGDKVVFSKYAGTEVKVDGDELLVIREDDVLGVIE
jgi:chaperonin GroES